MKKRHGKSGRRTENRRPGNPRRNPRSARELVVIYEDDDVVAVNKPSGLPSVPIKGLVTPSAWSLVDAELKTKRQRAFVVHRIDRFTSGVLLFAKGDKNRDILVKQFLAHTPVRQYLAVVRGNLKVPGRNARPLLSQGRDVSGVDRGRRVRSDSRRTPLFGRTQSSRRYSW